MTEISQQIIVKELWSNKLRVLLFFPTCSVTECVQINHIICFYVHVDKNTGQLSYLVRKSNLIKWWWGYRIIESLIHDSVECEFTLIFTQLSMMEHNCYRWEGLELKNKVVGSKKKEIKKKSLKVSFKVYSMVIKRS